MPRYDGQCLLTCDHNNSLHCFSRHSDEKSNIENGTSAVQVCPQGLKARAIGGKSNAEEFGVVGQRSPTMLEAELSGHQLGVLETGMSTEMQTVKTGSF